MPSASVGSPELALISAAVAQLAQRISCPVTSPVRIGDSKLSDAQAGHEKTLTALMVALAGASIIYGAGMIESGVTFDCAQLVWTMNSPR